MYSIDHLNLNLLPVIFGFNNSTNKQAGTVLDAEGTLGKMQIPVSVEFTVQRRS